MTLAEAALTWPQVADDAIAALVTTAFLVFVAVVSIWIWRDK